MKPIFKYHYRQGLSNISALKIIHIESMDTYCILCWVCLDSVDCNKSILRGSQQNLSSDSAFLSIKKLLRITNETNHL